VHQKVGNNTHSPMFSLFKIRSIFISMGKVEKATRPLLSMGTRPSLKSDEKINISRRYLNSSAAQFLDGELNTPKKSIANGSEIIV
jgi:hypothetical protein